MSDIARIKTAIERNIKAMELRPAIAQGTATTKVIVRDGLTCDIEDGGWKLVADEGKDDGGNGQGPDPGVFGRAALGSCLAIAYAMWAAKLDVPLTKVEVRVEADYDARAMFGLADELPPGWSAVRYYVEIESPAPEAAVLRVIETGDRYSSILDALTRPLPVTRHVQIRAPVA